MLIVWCVHMYALLHRGLCVYFPHCTLHCKMGLIGVSLSKPHIDHENSPARRIMVCHYLSMYHLPHVCRTLVPEIRVCPEILRVFRYY